jgi:hypothetical protein
MTESELEEAPEQVKNLVKTLPADRVEFLEITEQIVQLADRYIAENVVGKINREDCIHIALATLHRADVLISWNFNTSLTLSEYKVITQLICGLDIRQLRYVHQKR